MEPTAFNELSNQKSIRFIQEEKIANFNFLSIYVPVNDDNGNTYAYLNIPYLNSQSELNQEISGFLATLINLNAFIFLIAGAIAYLATERITASFSLISEKMKAINIGKHNEVIQWNRNDEIGVLVNEYNKMVEKLEQSAKALAQSEREGAWREMARQVAHEIKNPLTPMKLSIQYLQKATSNKAANVEELTNKVTTTLIEQIEQLSRIAGDFSQFANIGNVNLDYFNLNEVLSNLIQLHSAQEKVTIQWTKTSDSNIIFADKTQISRLFSNLIINAIEACENKSEANIIIDQTINTKHELITTITDNGDGIDEAMKNKIFTPNFTTKTSGTGLGLAISKGIVEKANGNIYFTTQKNIGTSFIVVLPLAKA
jgi:nitrogen fixation/metabolism regulation signal transduction histidine kinase